MSSIYWSSSKKFYGQDWKQYSCIKNCNIEFKGMQLHGMYKKFMLTFLNVCTQDLWVATIINSSLLIILRNFQIIDSIYPEKKKVHRHSIGFLAYSIRLPILWSTSFFLYYWPNLFRSQRVLLKYQKQMRVGIWWFKSIFRWALSKGISTSIKKIHHVVVLNFRTFLVQSIVKLKNLNCVQIFCH